MRHIKYTEDFLHIGDPKIRDWLKQENPYLPSRNIPSEFSPEEQGWLIVLDESDSIDELDTGIDAINNLCNIEYWEFVLFNRELSLWLAVVILTDGYGMSVAVPDTIIIESPLRQTFTDLLTP
jgi:hypothetical protein